MSILTTVRLKNKLHVFKTKQQQNRNKNKTKQQQNRNKNATKTKHNRIQNINQNISVDKI